MKKDKQKLAVIGNPISHSSSPVLHNFWLKKYGIDAEYEAIHIEKDNLKAEFQKLMEKGYTGLNVTVPFKEQVMKLCDEIDFNVKIIGAVNTVHLTEEGIIKGYNTDHSGFYKNISSGLSSGEDLSNKKAFIIGCGGASRAVVYSLLKNNTDKIFISNRTKEKADILKSEISKYMPEADIDVILWEEKDLYLKESDIIINTTSLGMKSKQDLDIPMDNIKKTALFTDIVYTPLETLFLRKASTQGNRTVDGLGMFLYQAAYSFEIWFGIKPEVDNEAVQIVKDFIYN